MVVSIGSDARETPIHKTNQEYINDILDSGHEVDRGILPDPDNKPIHTGYTDLSIYKWR